MALAETAEHRGSGTFQTTLRYRQAGQREFSDALPAVFEVGIEPAPRGASRSSRSQGGYVGGDPARPLLYLNRSHVISDDGMILITGYLLPKQQKERILLHYQWHVQDGYKCRLFLFGSRDRGRTWRIVSEVWRDRYFPPYISGMMPHAAVNGPTQAYLLRTSKQRILCAFRTDASLLLCESFDEGRTWSRPWMAGPDGSSPVLAQSGDLLALAHGRPDVNFALSTDDGYTWEAFTDLLPVDRTPAEARGLVAFYGYSMRGSTTHTDLISTGPGRFLLAYDTNWLSGKDYELPRNALWVAPITVSRARPAEKAVRFVPAAHPSVECAGGWRETGAEGGAYRCTDDPDARLLLKFNGAGVALVHPTFFDGGGWRVNVDGRDMGIVDLRTPQTWWGRRTPLADNLARKEHVLELVPRIRTEPRAPLMPTRWGAYEPLHAALYAAAGRTRAVLHGFEIW
jgi:hypothetical protein